MLLFPILQRGIQGGKSPQSTPVRGLLKVKIDQLLVSFDSKRCATSAKSTGYSQEFEFYNSVHIKAYFDLFYSPNLFQKKILTLQRSQFFTFQSHKSSLFDYKNRPQQFTQNCIQFFMQNSIVVCS